MSHKNTYTLSVPSAMTLVLHQDGQLTVSVTSTSITERCACMTPDMMVQSHPAGCPPQLVTVAHLRLLTVIRRIISASHRQSLDLGIMPSPSRLGSSKAQGIEEQSSIPRSRRNSTRKRAVVIRVKRPDIAIQSDKKETETVNCEWMMKNLPLTPLNAIVWTAYVSRS